MYLGMFLSALAGAMGGSNMWPMKTAKKYGFDHIFLIFMIMSFFVLPWLYTFMVMPNIFEIIKSINRYSLNLCYILGVFYSLGMFFSWFSANKLGLAISYGINSCAANISGTGILLAIKGSGKFSDAPDFFSIPSMMVLISMIGMCTSIIIIHKAGLLKTKNQQDFSITNKRRFFYIICAVFGGIFCNFAGFAFVYGGADIVGVLKVAGANEFSANIIFWGIAFLTVPITSAVICIIRISFMRSWKVFFEAPKEAFLVSVSSLQTILLLGIYATGIVMIGKFGAPIGVGFSTAAQISAGQLLGFLSGEWKGSGKKPKFMMLWALLIIMISLVILTIGNMIANQ